VSLLGARSVAFDKLAAYDRRFFPEARDCAAFYGVSSFELG
jgi:hypothetical protein